MRNLAYTIVLTLIANFSFSQQSAQPETKTYDSKLVGCWKGSEVGQQQKGLSKYWVSCRFENGTSTLMFIAIDKNGEVTQETENGKWWVENGKYYELHYYDGVTDVYDYEIIEDSVKFKSIELMGKKDSTYSFFDYKIQED